MLIFSGNWMVQFMVHQSGLKMFNLCSLSSWVLSFSGLNDSTNTSDAWQGFRVYKGSPPFLALNEFYLLLKESEL